MTDRFIAMRSLWDGVIFLSTHYFFHLNCTYYRSPLLLDFVVGTEVKNSKFKLGRKIVVFFVV